MLEKRVRRVACSIHALRVFPRGTCPSQIKCSGRCLSPHEMPCKASFFFRRLIISRCFELGVASGKVVSTNTTQAFCPNCPWSTCQYILLRGRCECPTLLDVSESPSAFKVLMYIESTRRLSKFETASAFGKTGSQCCNESNIPGRSGRSVTVLDQIPFLSGSFGSLKLTSTYPSPILSMHSSGSPISSTPASEYTRKYS